MNRIGQSILTILTTISLLGGADQSGIQIKPLKITGAPSLDGMLDETMWQNAAVYSNFETQQPDYGDPISESTLVRVAYDDENLYIGVEAFDRDPGKIRANVSKWDDVYDDDFITVFIDGLHDAQTAFGFTTNGVGSQGDFLSINDGSNDTAMDLIWDGAGRVHENGYTVEFKIPFKSLRYEASEQVSMGFQVGRHISRNSEFALFPPAMPELGSRLSQMATIVFTDLSYNRTYEVLPAMTSSSNFALDGDKLVSEDATSGGNLGVTAKVGLTSSLTMDLTYRPDFSQVEADAGQIAANSRFALFFAEKRPFFLEGADNFNVAAVNTNSGIWSMMHTRTIQTPVLGGKITGKLGSQNQVGILYAIDEAAGVEDSSGQNANVAYLRYKRLVGEDSYIGGASSSRTYNGSENHVVAVDGFFRINGKSSVSTNAVVSHFAPEAGDYLSPEHNFDINYNYGDRVWNFSTGYHTISNDFVLENGFTPLLGINTPTMSLQRNFYFEDSPIQSVTLGSYGYSQTYVAKELTESTMSGYVNIRMPRSTNFGMGHPFQTAVVGTDIYDSSVFNFFGGSQPHKMVRINGQATIGSQPHYDSDDPYQGDVIRRNITVNIQPTDQIVVSVNNIASKFWKRSSDELIYDTNIIRTKVSFQINKYLAIRGITEAYTDLDGSSLTTDLLASLTAFPGSVLFLGYGSQMEEPLPENKELATIGNRYQETARGLFFKASYNWRL